MTQKSPSGHHPTILSGYIFATKTCIDNRKKIVKQQYLLHMPHNMVNFDPLAAEIVSGEFGAPQLFSTTSASWLRYCTACSSGRQPNFAALNRGRHLCSAGRPSRWALAHISSLVLFLSFFFSSPNLSGRRLDVYHTSKHGMALVRISNAGLKCAARSSLEMQGPKNRQKFAIWAPSHDFVGLYLRN